MLNEVRQPAADDHDVECQVHHNQRDRHADHLTEAFQKHASQQHEQAHRQQRLPLQPFGHVVPVWIMNEVLGGIGGR